MKYLQVGILVALVAVAGLLALNLMNDRQARMESASVPPAEEALDLVGLEEEAGKQDAESGTVNAEATPVNGVEPASVQSARRPRQSRERASASPASKPTPTPRPTARPGTTGDSASPAQNRPNAGSSSATSTANAPSAVDSWGDPTGTETSRAENARAATSRTEPFDVDPPAAGGQPANDSAASAGNGQDRNRYELMRPDPAAPAPSAIGNGAAGSNTGANPAEPPRTVTLPAGTILTVRTTRLLSSETATVDETFTATLDQPIVVNDMVIAERGSRVEGTVVQVVDSGRVKGVAALSVQVTRINTSDGQTVPVQTQTFTMEAESSKGRDATRVGIATGIGAALGAIFGGGRGAAIGAAAGAGAGTGSVLAGKGKPAEIPSETRINFRLDTPVAITEQINP